MFGPIPWIAALCLTVGQASAFSQIPRQPVLAVRTAPEKPIIELRGRNQFLNFDVIVKNDSLLVLRISAIQFDVYDSTRRLAQRRMVNTDAFAPSIEVIGKQVLMPGESLDIFNPFFQFEPSVPLAEVRFTFCLLRESNEQERERNSHRLPDDCDFRQQAAVFPRSYQDKTLLTLPLRGKIFVWEGHDFYAHHLRVPLASSKIQALGISGNSNNFASDFIYLDEDGRAYHGSAQHLENWYGYGKPIYAPGSGLVVATANDIPENWFEDTDATKIAHPKLPPGKDPKDIGNFVLIDHQDGEYSLLVHMKPGSVTVRTGEQVKAGQKIGRIGFAGDSIFPHLHYSLMDGPELFKAWGLPTYFAHFRRWFGADSVEVQGEPVNSGDFLESAPDIEGR